MFKTAFKMPIDLIAEKNSLQRRWQIYREELKQRGRNLSYSIRGWLLLSAIASLMIFAIMGGAIIGGAVLIAAVVFGTIMLGIAAFQQRTWSTRI